MLDVARQAGVALSTVSYALNGVRPISASTRRRIQTAMAELGYQPHALARALASKRSRIIALLFSAPERGLGITEMEFITGAAEAARRYDYHLVLWSPGQQELDDLSYLLDQRLVDGVILMEITLHDQRVERLRARSLPFSLIGRCADNTGLAYADIDFEQTVQEALNYLFELGHTHIAFVNHTPAEYAAGYGPAVRAQDSFEQEMKTAGKAGAVRLCQATASSGFEAFNDLLAADPALSALLVMNDQALPGVLRAIQAQGRRVPEDISLVALVTSAQVAEMMTPPLTAMQPPSKDLGRLGVERLIGQLEPQASISPSPVLLPCQLVMRASTGAVNSPP